MAGTRVPATLFLQGCLALLGIFSSTIGTLEAGDITGALMETGDGALVAVAGDFEDFTPPAQALVIAQRDMEFLPSILAVFKGTTVAFPNDEEILYHNVYSLSPCCRFDLGTYRSGVTRTVTFPQEGIAEIHCTIHTRMYAVVLVSGNPYFAQVDGRGRFRIENVPPGRRTLQIVRLHGKSKTYTLEEIEVEIPLRGTVHVER